MAKSSPDTSSPTISDRGAVRLTADWLRHPALARLIDVLAAAGGPPRLVGGCVRDAVLGRPVTDIDLATPVPPEAVKSALEHSGIKVVPTGLDHGTVTAVIDGKGYEITTLRRDVETDGRRAVVAFTDDWREDAARRDFTINAMSASPDGKIYDYFGGLADAQAGCVRFVGDPAARIGEDYLRVLRFFRFQAWYGRQPPDETAVEALAAGVSGLGRLAAERVRSEVVKWLAAPDPLPSWRLAQQTGVAAWLFDDVPDARLRRLIRRENDLGVAPDPMRRLAAFVLPPGDGAEATAEKLRLSKAEQRYLATVEAAAGAGPSVQSDIDARRLAYKYGPGVARDALLLGSSPDDTLRRWLLALSRWSIPTFPVGGSDANSAGLSRGPEIGAALKAVERWWIQQDFKPDRAACLERLGQWVQDNGGETGT
ncbi:MAG: CCA tRNA nucleotidyltransferase [Pseudomonadota bacterium]